MTLLEQLKAEEAKLRGIRADPSDSAGLRFATSKKGQRMQASARKLRKKAKAKTSK